MIRCLHKYWLKEFVRIFIIIQALVMVLFVFIDYLSRLDRMLEYNVTFARGLWYVLLKLPYMFCSTHSGRTASCRYFRVLVS